VGLEAAQTMVAQVRDFPVVSGGDKKLSLGDLIDWTPKEFMSKVMLEEKVFETWYDCRTVLIGDGKLLRAQYTHSRSGIVISLNHYITTFFSCHLYATISYTL